MEIDYSIFFVIVIKVVAFCVTFGIAWWLIRLFWAWVDFARARRYANIWTAAFGSSPNVTPVIDGMLIESSAGSTKILFSSVAEMHYQDAITVFALRDNPNRILVASIECRLAYLNFIDAAK